MVLSVAAGAGEVVEFSGFRNITYMQEMTPEICAQADIGETARLVDDRDQKLYWVAKLKDGNCWMTQNLNFDGVGNLVTSLKDFGKQPGSGNYDAGDYVYTKPTTIISCTVDDSNPSSLLQCANSTYHWLGVENLQAFALPAQPVVVDLANGFYDAHYLVGNYYQANVAAQACPDHWILPNGEADIDIDKTFAKLFSYYGVNNSPISSDGYDMRLAPLYTLAGGIISGATVDTFGLARVGQRTYYWTSPSGDISSANVVVAPDEDLTHYNLGYGGGNGMSVRCVAE